MITLRKSIEKDSIAPFYASWFQLEKEIALLHSTKKKKAEAEMKQGIEIYKALLEQCTAEEKLEPLNNSERLAFIEANRSTYAAFRQLKELFDEMQKKIASKRAVLNRTE